MTRAQEPITKNDIALIHTEGLDEEIRCAMCTNPIANDRGCNGSCTVNDKMYKKVIDTIENHIISRPITTVSLEVYKQVAWERDIAIEQLHELGYEFGQKIEPTTKGNDLGVDVLEEIREEINEIEIPEDYMQSAECFAFCDALKLVEGILDKKISELEDKK